MEFTKDKNNLPRLYLPQKGDIFSVDVSALDLTTLGLVYSQQIKPIEIGEKKLPVKKWLPFIKKKHKYVVYEFTGNQ